MNSKTTALLIGYQNDFVKAGGTPYAAVQAVMKSTEMLANSLRLVEGARAHGVTTLHAPISFAERYPEVSAEPYGILAGVVASQAFRKGTWGAEIVAELQPAKDDIVVEGKRGLDCFASTNLDFILRSRGHHRRGPGGVPDELLRRVQDALGLRAQLPSGDADGPQGHAQRRGAAHGHGEEFCDVFPANDAPGVSRRAGVCLTPVLCLPAWFSAGGFPNRVR